VGKSGESPALSRNGNRPNVAAFVLAGSPNACQGRPCSPRGHLSRKGEAWGSELSFNPRRSGGGFSTSRCLSLGEFGPGGPEGR